MTMEAARSQDHPQKPVPVESPTAKPLQSEATLELSSKPNKANNVTETRAEVKPDSVKQESVKPEAIKQESTKPEAVKREVVKSPDKATIAAQTEKAEHGALTTELKSAVDKASKVIVKMPSAGSDNSDVVIKPDGKIVHNLNMDPQKPDSQNLTIAFEQKDPSTQDLSKEQVEALQKLMVYVKDKDKEFTVHTPDSVVAKEVKTQEVPQPSVNVEQEKVDSPRVEASQRSHSGGDQSYRSSYPRSISSSGSSDYGGDYSSSNSYSPAASEVNEASMSEVLMEWFTADPEKFKRLFPELYKKISGADGKIDLAKLQMLEKSGDPMLASLKDSLPNLVNEFPQTKALSGGPASLSADAVNSTGAKLADKASQVADEMSGSGYCAKGVSAAIERTTGKAIYGNANDMRETLPGHGFSEASSKDLKVGQIVHVYWTPEVYAQERAKRGNCPNYGDIAVIGKGKDGQLYAYNDNAVPLDNYLKKSRYDWNTLKAFNPPATA